MRFKYGSISHEDGVARFVDDLMEFVEAGKLVLGICNGFQLMVKLGLLPFTEGRLEQSVSLTHNDSGRFEDRWVHMKVDQASPCVFTRGLETLYNPVRHGEGKFVPGSAEVLEKINATGLAAVRYTTPSGEVTGDYPWNPNGSVEAIAGLCEQAGRYS